MSCRVFISGIGVVSALGASRDSFRDGLLAGTSGLAPITSFDVTACRTRIGASVTGFTPTDWIAPMKLRRMDDTARYAVVVTRQALEDAEYPLSGSGDEGTGVILGTFTAGGQATSEYLRALHQGGPTGAPAVLFNSTVGNAPASLAGLEYKLRGPNVTVSQKESSGLAAIVSATDALRLARARALVTGGVDAIFEIFFRVHDRFAVMTPASDGVRGPFDRDRNGFVLGEGGFALLLENEDSLRGRARQPYGEVLGVGAGSAAVPINHWPNGPQPLVRTMKAALEDAALAADDIGVVYASANATSTLDRIEAEALKIVFAGVRPLVTSIKGTVGEFGAVGAASCAAALLCGTHGEVPPILGLVDPDPVTAGLALATTRMQVPRPLVMVNSVGSGGSVFSVVLRVGG
jgi:3-oxoacyl-(acyl-carrier-protein) synthase